MQKAIYQHCEKCHLTNSYINAKDYTYYHCVKCHLYRKKTFSIFLSPAAMSLTKLSLGGNNLFMTSLFPARESLVSDIAAGDGNIEKVFLRCDWQLLSCHLASRRSSTKRQLCCHDFIFKETKQLVREQVACQTAVKGFFTYHQLAIVRNVYRAFFLRPDICNGEIQNNCGLIIAYTVTQRVSQRSVRISRICTVFLYRDIIRLLCVQSTVYSRCHTSTDSLSPP